jgi:hypothetical protein
VVASLLKVARQKLANLSAAAGKNDAQGAAGYCGDNLHGYRVLRFNEGEGK